MPMKILVGDEVELKKKHPCGSFFWEVTRIGADFKIKCKGCGCVVMLPRTKLEKNVKRVNGIPAHEIK